MSIETARQGWIEQYREMGNHPYPAPDAKNPERWECKCDAAGLWTAVWRILTPTQVAQKFAHLSRRDAQAR